MNREVYLKLIQKLIMNIESRLDEINEAIKNIKSGDGNYPMAPTSPIMNLITGGTIIETAKNSTPVLKPNPIYPIQPISPECIKNIIPEIPERIFTIEIPTDSLNEKLLENYNSIINTYRILILIYLLLSQKQPIIDNFLRFICGNNQTNNVKYSLLQIDVDDNISQEKCNNIAKLIAILSAFKAKDIKEQIKLVRQFINEECQEQQEISKYFNKDGTFTNYGSYPKFLSLLEGMIAFAKEKQPNLSNPQKEVIKGIKQEIKEFIQIIASYYKKANKPKAKSANSQTSNQEKTAKPAIQAPQLSVSIGKIRKAAREALKEYYDEVTKTVIKIPEDIEGIRQIIIQCEFDHEKENAIISLFEDKIKYAQYRNKYNYLSDEEFEIFYKALKSSDKEIETIVNDIEEFHGFIDEEEDPDEKQKIKTTIKELIENLKPLVQKNKKPKTEEDTSNNKKGTHKRGRKKTYEV